MVTECELLQRVDEARQELRAAEAELAEFYAEQYVAKTGIKPGVVLRDDRGYSYLVTRVEGHSFGGSVYGKKIRKDGTPGVGEQFICLSKT